MLTSAAHMREYETIYVLRPDVTRENQERIATRVGEAVTRESGKLTNVPAKQQFTLPNGMKVTMVPFGTVPNQPGTAFPANFNARPSPYGVGFTGAACSEEETPTTPTPGRGSTRRRPPRGDRSS